MTLAEFKKKAKQIPDLPGVYFFLGKRKEILYIGKAADLRSRTRSYFSKDLKESRSELIVQMVEKAKYLDWRVTDSVLEALILEANLIKTHKPRFNTDEKDDKSFNYVAITKEDFPRVLLVRGKELAGGLEFKTKAIFGPFPHGLQLKEAMRLVRKIFPYRDTCIPHGSLGAPKVPKPCFNRQIGLCPGVCSGEISKEAYARSIRHLSLFFQGKKKALLRELERDMKRAAKDENFEQASEYRRQIFALQHIQDVSLIKAEYRNPTGPVAGGYRIEAYDIAHFRGASAYGVMTVVENGSVKKEQYRTFRLRTAKAGDDPGALKEVLSRRLAHTEWTYPRLIVVDGSKAQMNAAQAVLEEHGIRIPLVGVVKNEKHQARNIVGESKTAVERESEILLANAEAHRFAIGKHRLSLRKRAL